MKKALSTRTLRIAMLFVASAGLLSACSGNGVGVSPPPPPAPQEDFFGTGFGVDFRAAANTEPVVPMPSDIIAVSLTTEPQTLH